MTPTTLSTTQVAIPSRPGAAGIARAALAGLGVVLALATAAVAVADFVYRQQVAGEIDAMFARSKGVPAGAPAAVVTESDLAPLPEPVQRWLRYSGVVGKERVSAVRLKMKGEMRQTADGPWFPIEAEEYYTTNPPALMWTATAKPAPVMWMRIKDSYQDGRGGLGVKLFSAVTVADGHGAGIDQGTLLRYLNETMWFPAGALADYIRWEPVDDTSAKATMSYGGLTASATFIFDEAGRFVNMIAEQRYRDQSGTYDRWETPITGYAEFNGFRLPSTGEAVWKLSTGDLPYGRLELTDVEYNRPARY